MPSNAFLKMVTLHSFRNPELKPHQIDAISKRLDNNLVEEQLGQPLGAQVCYARDYYREVHASTNKKKEWDPLVKIDCLFPGDKSWTFEQGFASSSTDDARESAPTRSHTTPVHTTPQRPRGGSSTVVYDPVRKAVNCHFEDGTCWQCRGDPDLAPHQTFSPALDERYTSRGRPVLKHIINTATTYVHPSLRGKSQEGFRHRLRKFSSDVALRNHHQPYNMKEEHGAANFSELRSVRRCHMAPENQRIEWAGPSKPTDRVSSSPASLSPSSASPKHLTINTSVSTDSLNSNRHSPADSTFGKSSTNESSSTSSIVMFSPAAAAANLSLITSHERYGPVMEKDDSSALKECKDSGYASSI